MPRFFRTIAWIGLVAWLPISLPVPAGADDGPAGNRLEAVIARYWDDQLRTHPVEATIFVGDPRHSGQLDDPSLNSFQAWLDRLRATRAELSAIDPVDLRPEDRIDREILLQSIDDRLEYVKFGDHLIPFAPIVRYAPDLHFDDLHLLVAQLGEFQPTATIDNLESFLKRLKYFPALGDRLIGLMQQGIAENRLPPRAVMPKVIAQLRGLSKPHALESPLWAIVGRLPAGWSLSDRQVITDRVKERDRNRCGSHLCSAG